MDTKEKLILGSAGTSHFFTHFYMLVFPALLLPISRDYGLPLSRAVDISFSMYLLYGLMAAPWGILSDRWSHKGSLAIGIGLAGLGMFLAGFGAHLRFSVPVLAASFALTGIGCSAFHPAGTALLTQGIGERGRALGISGIFGNIGIAAAPITAGVLNFVFGWQTGLMILGGLGIATAVTSGIAPIGIERGSDKLVVEKMEKRDAVKLFAVFAAGMTLGGLMYRAFTTILPAFLELKLGNIGAMLRGGETAGGSAGEINPALDTLIANLVTTAVYGIGIVGQLLGGRIADRYSLKWGYFAFFALALPCAAAMIFLEGALLVPAAGIFVLFVLGVQPIENSLIAYLTPAKWRSLSYGIKFSLVFGVGALAVKLIGLIQERTGSLDYVILSIAGFLAALLLVFSVFLFMSRGKDIRH
jgi:MFS family permease